MPDQLDTVARALAAVDLGPGWWDYWLDSDDPADRVKREDFRALAQAAIDALGLTEEARWIPVEESGDEWQPLTRERAEEALRSFGIGGAGHQPDLDSPVVRIESETRLVSPWVRAEPTND